MPRIDEVGTVPRKDLHIFYVLDTSGSMADEGKIGMLNRAMEETLDALQDVAKHNGDANLKIAVMEFNTGCKWITDNGPENMADFEWEDLKAGGLTDIGDALDELDNKMSTHAWLNSMMGALMPVIIFMTDGYATDDWEKKLDKVRENRWFRRATKIGFALGNDADKKMIASVVGNSEAVIQTNDLEVFKKLIRIISVTSSMLKSQPNADKTPTGAIIDDAIKTAGVEKEKIVEHLDPDEYKPEEPIVEDEKKTGNDDGTWAGGDDEEW